MAFEEFSKYVKNKSLDESLHLARRENFERILANEVEIDILLTNPKPDISHQINEDKIKKIKAYIK